LRCRFSSSASRRRSSSLVSRMIAGIDSNPARRAALQRRSPMTSSKDSPSAVTEIGRTTTGCRTPTSRSEWASSSSSSSSNIVRGLRGFSRTSWIGISANSAPGTLTSPRSSAASSTGSSSSEPSSATVSGAASSGRELCAATSCSEEAGAGTSSTGSCWAGVEITSSTSTAGLPSLELPAAEAASAAEGACCSCVLLGAGRSAAASAGTAAVGSSTGCSTCAVSEVCVRVGVVAFDGAGDGGVAGASFAAEEVFDEDAARFVVLFVAVVVDLPAFVPAEVEPAAFEPVDFPAAAFEPVDFPAAAFVPSYLEPADVVPADVEAADFVAALFVLELLVPVDLVPEDVPPEDVPLELAAAAAERVVPLPAFRDREPVR